ncbi:MAG: DUF3791 domain-containing protein [Clostridia bacterium]|nr:DUF3791 domain-containing protein [Clostridia bacterium]
MRAHPILLQMKYADVIECFAKTAGLSFDEALKQFYGSLTYQLMREGVGDTHCLSEAYLAEDLMMEMNEKTKPTQPISAESNI